MQFDRIVEILGLWPHYVVAGLAVPIVVGVLARKVVLTLFSALLSLLSLTLLFDAAEHADWRIDRPAGHSRSCREPPLGD
jgi:hypothetical protein